jgi:hypothetical protein
MNTVALLFIVSSLYSIINYHRLSIPVLNRVYKNKVQVYFDLIFYAIELFYFIWLILITIFEFHITWPLLMLMFLSWIFLRTKTSRNNLIYQLIRVVGLVSIYLQIKPL